MKTRLFRLIAVALVIPAAGAVFVSAQKETDPTLAKVADYRQWTRVTREPVPIPVPEAPTTNFAFDGG